MLPMIIGESPSEHYRDSPLDAASETGKRLMEWGIPAAYLAKPNRNFNATESADDAAIIRAWKTDANNRRAKYLSIMRRRIREACKGEACKGEACKGKDCKDGVENFVIVGTAARLLFTYAADLKKLNTSDFADDYVINIRPYGPRVVGVLFLPHPTDRGTQGDAENTAACKKKIADFLDQIRLKEHRIPVAAE